MAKMDGLVILLVLPHHVHFPLQPVFLLHQPECKMMKESIFYEPFVHIIEIVSF